MKIVFLYHWNEGPQSGVQQKVRRQVEAWKAAGHEVQRVIVCRQEVAALVADEGQTVLAYRTGLDRLSVWNRAARAALALAPDLIYHRYDLYARGLERLARTVPTVIEINTDDVLEYPLQGRGRALYNRLTRRRLLSNAAGLVYVTRALSRSAHFARYARPGLVLSNGTDLERVSVLPIPEETDCPVLVFIGTPGQPWQGVDKLTGLARAWPEARIEVIGAGVAEFPQGVPDNLILHGYLDPAAYAPVLARATAALGSLALHRKGMGEASPLKVREYLAAGLPTILAYDDTDFPEDADFLLKLPNEEDNLLPHLDAIQTFVRRWQDHRVPRESVGAIDSGVKERARLAFMTGLTRESSPRTLVLLTTGLAHGGAETQVVSLALGFRARGWRVEVISLRPPLAFTDMLTRVGIGVHSLGMQPGRPSLGALRRYASLLGRLRPDVVHSHMVHANLLGRIARPLTRTPVLVSTAHNIDEGGGWRTHAYRLTDCLASRTTNVSRAATARYVRDGLVPAHRIETLPNGVDVARFTPDAGRREALRAELGLQGRFVWLCVGRFVAAKDHATLLRAFGPLAQEQPHLTLLLAGEGETQAEVRHLAHTFGVERQVVFLGVRDDVPDLMAAADGLVLSSAWEGLPMVLLEAGASGLPMVATAVGGSAETLRPGLAHRLIPPADPEALRRAMCEVSRLPEGVRRREGESNAAWVAEHFGLDQILDHWEALYRRLGAR